jgi:hypothetical protein
LFVVFAILDRPDGLQGGKIVVTAGKIEHLRASFSRVWQRPPSSAELDGLIQDYIREEVLAREAVALGLDRDDTVIRRRLRQKMEFIANDLAAPAEPSEAELAAFLAQHPDRFRVEPRVTFRQVYLNADRRGDGLHQDAARLLVALHQESGVQADFQQLGDATLLSPELADVQASDVSRQCGKEFTQQLAQVPERRWSGPVRSGYGMHLVYVQAWQPERMPELPDVRAQVAREWADARRRDSNEQFYQNLMKRYAITIEQPSSAAPKHTATTEVRR